MQTIWSKVFSSSFTRSMGQLMELKISQVVFALELFSASHTRRANVDARDLSRRPAQGMLRCLRRSATCDEDGIVVPIGRLWAKRGDSRRDVFVDPARALTIFFKAIDRRRIRVAVVEVPDLLRDIQ